MNELLLALRKGSKETIDNEACELFITQGGLANRAQIDEFERYAPCRIDVFGWGADDSSFGVIRYNDKIYPFG